MRDFIVWTTAFILVFFAAVMVMLSLAALMDGVDGHGRDVPQEQEGEIVNRPLYDAAAAVHEAAMRWGKHGLSSQAIRGATVNGIITRGEADSLERLIFDAFGQPAWVPCPGAHGKGCALHAMMEILCTEGP